MLSCASIALLFAVASSTALPGGTVITGVSTMDGTHTDITAFLPDGTARVLAVEEHAHGIVPKGALDVDDAHLALAVQAEGAEGASVVVLDVASGARDVLGQRAIAMQAPVLVDDGSVLFVRAAETPSRSTFDLVRGAPGGEEVLASVEGAWLSPVRDADAHYLAIAPDGTASIVRFDEARHAFVDVAMLGTGRIRSPALLGDGRVAFENDGALVFDGTVRYRGLPGVDPIAIQRAVVAGSGKKHASLVVLDVDGKERVIDFGRAGVASPRAGAPVNGELVVVAWLDRGQSLPGELWIAQGARVRRLIEPKPGVAVEVYGVVGESAGGAR